MDYSRNELAITNEVTNLTPPGTDRVFMSMVITRLSGNLWVRTDGENASADNLSTKLNDNVDQIVIHKTGRTPHSKKISLLSDGDGATVNISAQYE